MKILIVDDEQEIRDVLRLLLKNKGYEVLEAKNGNAAVAIAESERDIDLIIMDIMMPGLTGVGATRRIREFSSVPVLFLTAKSLDRDKSNAYAAGGDDYLIKPFSAGELLMKVDAITRRYTSYRTKEENVAPDAIRLGSGVVLCPDTREVMKNGAPIDVRDKELDVLIFLARHRGEVMSPAAIYEAVWEEMPLASSSNTVTVHILNLRRKLEDTPSAPKLIRTVWGKGYQID